MKNITDEVKNTLSRLQKYCAREDRSTQRIRERLYDSEKLSPDEKEWIIDQLTQDRFLDDERFASTFVRSKVNQNRWGVEKIKHGLIRHKIKDSIIEKSLAEIDRDQYRKNLHYLLKQKRQQTDDFVKLTRYLLQRGYRYEEILDVFENIS